MKRIALILIISLAISDVLAQTLAERISTQSCGCIGDLRNLDSLEFKFKKCFGTSMTAVVTKDKDLKFEYTVENIQRVSREAFELLPSICPQITKLVIEEREELFYAPSSSNKANKNYEQGVALLESQDFKGATAEFKKAIEQDKKFVLAYDDLAMSYRRINNYKDAIRYYNLSLEIFPEGDFALVNIGSVYILENDLDKADKIYLKIIALYPENPEGYFGKGKVALLQEKYEEALPFFCQAYRIYVSTNSRNALESEKIISLIYAKLKEINKEDLFQKVIQQYDIEFNIK